MLPYYYSLNEFLQKEYGHKLYKLALNGGMTCPNRDGLIDTKDVYSVVPEVQATSQAAENPIWILTHR